MPAERVVVLDLVCFTAAHLEDESRTPTLSRLAREGWSAPLVPPFPGRDLHGAGNPHDGHAAT
jgi:hypothetical protein